MATHWRAMLQSGPKGSRHWLTRVSYYETMRRLLSEPGVRELNWSGVVAAHPHGSRSTFYSVTGPRAVTPLGEAYLVHGADWARSIAMLYREDPVGQLISETKAWSYWPYREAWVRQLDDQDPCATPEAASRSLFQAAERWAHQEPVLASAARYRPPPCMVEDLLICSRRGLTVEQLFQHARRQLQLSSQGRRERVEIPFPRPGRTPPAMAEPSSSAGAVAKLQQALALLREAATRQPQETDAGQREAMTLLSEALNTLARTTHEGATDE